MSKKDSVFRRNKSEHGLKNARTTISHTISITKIRAPSAAVYKFNGLMNVCSLFEILEAEEATGTGEATGQAEEAKGTEKVT